MTRSLLEYTGRLQWMHTPFNWPATVTVTLMHAPFNWPARDPLEQRPRHSHTMRLRRQRYNLHTASRQAEETKKHSQQAPGEAPGALGDVVFVGAPWSRPRGLAVFTRINGATGSAATAHRAHREYGIV